MVRVRAREGSIRKVMPMPTGNCRSARGNTMECTCRRLRNSAAAVRTKTLFATGVFRVAALALMLVGLGSAPAYAQTYSCANDAQGANDQPGQKDLTRMCVAAG